jgi:hypothetical protein
LWKDTEAEVTEAEVMEAEVMEAEGATEAEGVMVEEVGTEAEVILAVEADGGTAQFL